MDTSAARHHAEKQNPDASVPSAYSPGSANSAKASVPSLTRELREHARGTTRATNSELGSGEVAMDTSAARHHAEKQNPDASVPSAYSPGSANSAKASVPSLTRELREHAGGSTRATNSELGSGEVAMDTSAARHHAEKQNPDASVPSAYSPGSANSAKASVPSLTRERSEHARGTTGATNSELGSGEVAMDTSAARHHAEKQNPDASVPSAYSPGSANSAKASVPSLTRERSEHARGLTRATNSELGSGEVAMDTSAGRHPAATQNPDASVHGAYPPDSVVLEKLESEAAAPQSGNLPRLRQLEIKPVPRDRAPPRIGRSKVDCLFGKSITKENKSLASITQAAVAAVKLTAGRKAQEKLLQQRGHQTHPSDNQRDFLPTVRLQQKPFVKLDIKEMVTAALQHNGMIMPPAGYDYPSRLNLKLAKHHSMRTIKEPYPKPWNLPTGKEILDDRVLANRRALASRLRKQKAGAEVAAQKKESMREELKLAIMFQEVLEENGEPSSQVERKIDTLSKHIGDTPGVTIARDGSTSLMTPERQLYDPNAECGLRKSPKAVHSTAVVPIKRTASTNTPMRAESQKLSWADQVERGGGKPE